MKTRKPKLAVFKLSSCDGCQLSLLDAEDELLEFFNEIEIAYFPEASSRMLKGPYDIAVVEGSITTPHNVESALEIRKSCKYLITIGACATAGGIQALKNWKDVKEFVKIVYPTPEYITSLVRSMPVASYVNVDFELRGCPVNKYQLIEVIMAFLQKRKPNINTGSTCIECKLKGNVCVMVTQGIACMGPITHEGCGAICPSYNRGCYGCFGPTVPANTKSLVKKFKELDYTSFEVMTMLRSYNAYAEQFRKESEANEKQNN
jgi:coenzyme F420-reducing hydrogenase gamma subunit